MVKIVFNVLQVVKLVHQIHHNAIHVQLEITYLVLIAFLVQQIVSYVVMIVENVSNAKMVIVLMI